MDGGNTVKGQAQQVIELAKSRESRFNTSREKTRSNGDRTASGVVAQVAAYEYAELDDLYKAAEEK